MASIPPYTPEQKQSLEAIPFSEREWPESPYRWVRSAMKGKEEMVAMEFILKAADYEKKWHQIQYGEFLRGIHQTALMLQGLRLQSSDRVAVVLPNVPELPMALLGASLVSQFVLVDAGMSIEQMKQALQAMEPSVLITLAPYPGLDLWERMEQVREGLSRLRIVFQVDLTRYLGRVKRWQARQILRRKGKAEPIADQKIADFHATKDKFPTELPEDFPFVPKTAPSLWTVGSFQQGKPRFLAYSSEQICASLWGLQQMFEGQGPHLWGESCTSLGAVLVDLLFPLVDGEKMIIPGPDGFHDKALFPILRWICEDFGVNRMRIGIGSAIQLEDWGAGGLLYVEWILNGARYPLNFIDPDYTDDYYQLWISAEGHWLGIGPLEPKKQTVLPPLPPYLTGALTPNDSDFSLRLSGPVLGKLGSDQMESEDFIRKTSEEQWQYLGGKSDQLTHKGESFSPFPIEKALENHPAVQVAIVVGREDESAGQVPVAYLQLRPGDQTGPKEIYEYLVENWPHPNQVPQGFRILDIVPRNSLGHINRKALEAQENAR